MFAKINALPGSQPQPPIRNRYRYRDVCQHGADMRWHVIRTLAVMAIEAIAVRHHVLHKSLQVVMYVSICILRDNYRGAGMLHEDMA